MDIHKPKPVHSWREFATEIGVIVIGIAIALTGEQIVEGFHTRRQVEEDRAALAREVAHNLASGIERMRLTPCADARLEELNTALDQAERTGFLPALPLPGRPRNLTFSSGVWSSVVASPAATHFPKAQLQSLGFIYTLIAASDRLSDEETVAWSTLYTMAGPAKRLDPASAQNLRVALVNARTINLEISTFAIRLSEWLGRLGLDFDADEKADIHAALTAPLATIDTRHVCGPMAGPIPANHGQSPWHELLPESDQALKRLGTEF